MRRPRDLTEYPDEDDEQQSGDDDSDDDFHLHVLPKLFTLDAHSGTVELKIRKGQY